MLGLSTSQSREKLWKQKYGSTATIKVEDHPPHVQRMMDWGRYCEPHIRQGLVSLGVLPPSIREVGLFTRTYGAPGLTIGASPDGMTDEILVEIKASCPLMDGTFKDPVTTVPMGDVPQCITQMAVTGIHRSIYARHNGLDQVAVFELEFSQPVWEHILQAAKRFTNPKMNPGRMKSGEKKKTTELLQAYICQMTRPVGTFPMVMPRGYYDT